MRQKGARKAGPRAKARPTSAIKGTADRGALVANLGTQITAAAERAEMFGGIPAALNPTACQAYGREIEQEFGVTVDSPQLTALVMRAGRLRLQHFKALWRIAGEYSDLLASQRERRRDFLESHHPGMAGTYREAAIAVAPHYRAPGIQSLHDPLDFDAAHAEWEAGTERLITWLRNAAGAGESREGTQRGPLADVALANAAANVSDWTKQHGQSGKADWKATVKILLCHGFELEPSVERIARDPKLLARVAGQLEDRVRQARQRGTIRLKREGTVPSP